MSKLGNASTWPTSYRLQNNRRLHKIYGRNWSNKITSVSARRCCTRWVDWNTSCNESSPFFPITRRRLREKMSVKGYTWTEIVAVTDAKRGNATADQRFFALFCSVSAIWRYFRPMVVWRKTRNPPPYTRKSSSIAINTEHRWLCAGLS